MPVQVNRDVVRLNVEAALRRRDVVGKLIAARGAYDATRGQSCNLGDRRVPRDKKRNYKERQKREKWGPKFHYLNAAVIADQPPVFPEPVKFTQVELIVPERM